MRKTKSKIKRTDFSIIKELKAKNLVDDRFLVRISNIPLEDLIACKLEVLSHKVNGKMFGLSLARSIKKITQEALIKSRKEMLKQANKHMAAGRENLARNIKKQFDEAAKNFEGVEPLKVDKLGGESFAQLKPFEKQSSGTAAPKATRGI